MMERKLIPACEARKILGFGPEKLRRWTRDGLVPSVVDPETGRISYSRPALEKWLEANCPKVAS